MVKRKNEAAKEVEQEPSKEGEEEAAMESESAPAGRSGPPGGNPAVRGGLPPAGKVTKVNLIQFL